MGAGGEPPSPRLTLTCGNWNINIIFYNAQTHTVRPRAHYMVIISCVIRSSMYTIEEERFQSSTKSNCWFCSSPFSRQLVPRSLTLIFLMRTSYVDSPTGLTAVPDLVNAAEEISKVPFSCNRPRFLTDTATYWVAHRQYIFFYLTYNTDLKDVRRKKNIVVSGNMDKKIGSVGRFFFLQWCF